MVADFIHLGVHDDNKSVMVMLGLEEHLYVRIAKDVINRMELPFHLGAMYSRIIKGFNGYPKMSKSIKGSSINVEMGIDEIRDMLVNGEGHYTKPNESVAYQMMCAVSNYSPKELNILKEKCKIGGKIWEKAKNDYAEYLDTIFKKWPKNSTRIITKHSVLDRFQREKVKE